MTATSEWEALENRVTGDRMLVLHRGTDAEGTVLEVQFDLPPHAAGSPMHRHSRLSERFEVLDGALQVCVEGAWHTLRAGESAVVRAGQAHCFRNDTSAWVTFITEIRPPGDFERFLRTWYGLANDGRANRDGIPRNPLHLARCLRDADLTFTGAPAGLQRVALAALVSLGNIIGAYSALMDYDIAPTMAHLDTARS